MLVEYVVARAVDVLPRFEVIFCQLEFCVNGGLLLLRVWYQCSIWIVFIGVCGCWSGGCYVEMERPAHPLTADWGHGIFLSAFAKCFLSSQMLTKLGLGLMLGGFAKSIQTASYEIDVFIFPRGSNNIRLRPMR